MIAGQPGLNATLTVKRLDAMMTVAAERMLKSYGKKNFLSDPLHASDPNLILTPLTMPGHWGWPHAERMDK